jgi:hypothetical protein
MSYNLPMGNSLNLLRRIAIVAVSVFALPLFAIDNNFPIAKFYPEPVGILYPGMNVAGGVNPAALPMSPAGSAVQLGYSPAPTGNPSQFFWSVAHSSNKFGFSIGYQGNSMSGTTSHNGFIGMGGMVGKIAMGLSLRGYNLNAGVNPSVDYGLITQLKNLDLAVVFYDLQGIVRMGAAVGTRTGGKLNLEGNILLPPFSNMSLGYLFTVSAQLTLMPVVVYFRTSYNTYTLDFSHSLGLGAWVAKMCNVSLQYSTPSRVGGAVTIVF